MNDTRSQPPPVPPVPPAGSNGSSPSIVGTPSPFAARAAAAAPEPTYEYELVVIGGGPAGEKGAAQAAYFGHKTVVIERYKELGGACINWGTIASKTLRETSLFLSGFRTR